MSGDVIDMNRWRFTHERAPARRLSDRELYLRALSQQKPADNAELDRLIGALDPFPGGDAA